MPAKRKTRKQKERIKYHLEGNLLRHHQKIEAQEKQAFSYLEAKYVKKDLLKTFTYSLLMLGILFLAKRYLN